MNSATQQDMIVDGKHYSEQSIRILLQQNTEQSNHRIQNVSDFFKVYTHYVDASVSLNPAIVYRLSRLAGTSLLEAAYILSALERVRHLPGDWCEYGVAHGRTSALLAQCMLNNSAVERQLWLYDSFEGLPTPHDKDILIDDIFQKGSIGAYAGLISMPERHVREELATVRNDTAFYRVVSGWITLAALRDNAPDQISFAYLDMDFYQSTYDTLKFLVDRLVPGGVAIVDDYGVFSEGVRTAVCEIMAEHEGCFSLEHPLADKFVVLTRSDHREQG